MAIFIICAMAYIIFSIGISKIMRKAFTKDPEDDIGEFIAFMLFWPVITPVYAFL